MRFWKWILPSSVLLALAMRLSACPAGYESLESLVRHARLIVQLEVLSGEAAPVPPGMTIPPQEDNYGRHGAKAQVRVIEVIKGECGVREFTLIGGPFHTCAPSHYYHSFVAGQRLVLILDSALPAEVKMVAVTWRNRIVDKSADELRQLMQLARVNWKRAVERHRRVAPEEMALAERLQAEFMRDPVDQGPAQMSFEVMACLTVLLNDPDHLAPAEAEEPQEKGLGYSNAAFVELYQTQGAHISGYDSRAVLPPSMRKLFPRANTFDYRPPAGARRFNLRLLRTILVDELQVPPALAARTLEDPKVRAMCDDPQDGIIWMRLRPGRRYDAPLMETALSFLMLLADPEPDGLVWGTFGMGGNKDAPFLPTDLFVGFLGKYQERLPNEHGNAHLVLTHLPHPQIAPLVRAYAGRGAYDNFPEVLVRYFVRLGSEPDVLNAVGIMEKNAEQFIKSVSKPGGDPTTIGYRLENYLAETTDAMNTLAAAGEFKAAQARLNELAKHLKAVQMSATSR